eukprot:GHVS01105505.1.p2 GENE.GHVS01105505.1~~GHVS01105505.1.p2  ORF type:complete len:113 (+),score=25.83 GHVS01105505.1:105-443(+)
MHHFIIVQNCAKLKPPPAMQLFTRPEVVVSCGTSLSASSEEQLQGAVVVPSGTHSTSSLAGAVVPVERRSTGRQHLAAGERPPLGGSTWWPPSWWHSRSAEDIFQEAAIGSR